MLIPRPENLVLLEYGKPLESCINCTTFHPQKLVLIPLIKLEYLEALTY